MLKSISLQDVQVHRELSLEFSPGMNVITAPSDSGKTSIVRGFEWLRKNRPSGETLRNWDSKTSDPMSVEVSLEEGSVAITREDGKTSYLLQINGEEKTFSAIKTDVPKEITEALNLSDYNVQDQHDKYFLLQDSPGEVARKLNELVGLDIIDTAFKNIGSKVRELTSEINTLKLNRDRLEIQLEGYTNLDEIEKLITSIEKRQAAITVMSSTLNDLQKTVSSLESIRKEKVELTPIPLLEDRIPPLLDRIKKVLELKDKGASLSSIVRSLSSIKEDREADNLWLEIEPYLIKLSDKILSLQGVRKSKEDLESLSGLFNNVTVQRKIITNDLDSKTSKYLELLTRAGICPTCGTKIDEKKTLLIKESL